MSLKHRLDTSSIQIESPSSSHMWNLCHPCVVLTLASSPTDRGSGNESGWIMQISRLPLHSVGHS